MNSEQFTAFYKHYYEISVKIASGIVQSRFVAEDVTQEVFVYFYRIKDKLDISSERKLHTLVVMETMNKGRDYLRKSYVKREVMFDNDIAELQYKSVESAEAAILGMEKAQYISLAFENLRRKNPVNYMIFMKVQMQGIPTDEVAREFGYTRNNVNNRVLRARNWLLEELVRLEKERFSLKKAYLCQKNRGMLIGKIRTGYILQ